ncbi:hypothetical protein O181_102605, partial [Austropuccinia psidii MF-1]|nr:hypothetical protein [Austropuccinia psidii MF-1]
LSQACLVPGSNLKGINPSGRLLLSAAGHRGSAQPRPDFIILHPASTIENQKSTIKNQKSSSSHLHKQCRLAQNLRPRSRPSVQPRPHSRSSGGPEEPLLLKVKPTTKFHKIYSTVAQHRRVEMNSFRLHYDGQRLLPNDSTPADLQFDENETLDYVVEQIGGSSLRAMISRPWIAPRSCHAL